VALTGSGAAPLWRCMRAVDEVIVLPVGRDWAGWREFVRTLLDVRARRFDVAIDFTSPAYKWVSFIGGIPRRTYMKFDRLWWLLPRRHDRWRATHATEHYYHCARELDLPDWEGIDHAPRLELPHSAHISAAAFLRRVNAQRGRLLVGMHPGGAGWSGLKRWPPHAFAAAADRLHEEVHAQILLLGGADERDLARAVRGAMRHTPLDAVGRVPLLTSFGLIAACDLFVGNDSSLLHAAAALGTPYVGILGPTSPASFRPIPSRPGQGRLVQPDPPCIEPRRFVGGSVIWDRPRCTGRCAALAVLPPQRVVAAALEHIGRLHPDLGRSGVTGRLRRS
jgi:ADP-heptose:LPS heptosyltransferase